MLPTPAMIDWSMTISPMARFFEWATWAKRSMASTSERAPASRGSGPSFDSAVMRSSSVMRSQRLGPIRSATAWSVYTRRRTAPTGSGGSHSPALASPKPSPQRVSVWPFHSPFWTFGMR